MRYYLLSDRKEVSKYLLNKMNGSQINLTEASFLDQASLELPIFFSAGCESRFNIKIGAFSSINSCLGNYVSEVGRYSFLGRNVSFLGAENFSSFEKSLNKFFLVNPAFFDDSNAFSGTEAFGIDKKFLFSPIVIGSGVFISDNVKINPGVKIGNGALIYSGSMVDRDIEPYEIFSGKATSKPQYRFSKNTRDALEEVFLWNYDLLSDKSLNFFSDTTLLAFIEKIKLGEIDKLKPVSFLLKNERGEG